MSRPVAGHQRLLTPKGYAPSAERLDVLRVCRLGDGGEHVDDEEHRDAAGVADERQVEPAGNPPTSAGPRRGSLAIVDGLPKRGQVVVQCSGLGECTHGDEFTTPPGGQYLPVEVNDGHKYGFG